MNIYSIENGLKETEVSALSAEKTLIIVGTTQEAARALTLSRMEYEGEINLREINVCKIESQPNCMAGTLCIPKQVDVAKSRYRVQLFVNRENVVIIDDEKFSLRVIARVQERNPALIVSKEGFLCRFFMEFISRDMEMIGLYNKRLMDLEEKVSSGKIQGFHSTIMPIRSQLLVLRSYYDELMDMAAQFEENENEFFPADQLKFFGTIADRADRLMGKTAQLLEYAQQIRDSYQFTVDSDRNKNMQLLTVISTVFYPLTLITGWFGMNFVDMPGLKNGYPVVVALSVAVVVGIIIWFKKKKFF